MPKYKGAKANFTPLEILIFQRKHVKTILPPLGRRTTAASILGLFPLRTPTGCLLSHHSNVTTTHTSISLLTRANYNNNKKLHILFLDQFEPHGVQLTKQRRFVIWRTSSSIWANSPHEVMKVLVSLIHLETRSSR